MHDTNGGNMNSKEYNNLEGYIYKITLDGYFRKEDAIKQVELLSECGFQASIGEV